MEPTPWDPDDVERRLDDDGRLLTEADSAPPIPPGLDLRALYKAMVRARRLDLALARHGLPMWAASAGEEAVSVACATLARDTEWIFPGARDLGVALTRGADLDELFTQILGRRYVGTAGTAGAPDQRVAPVPETLGMHLTLAAGRAQAEKLEGSRRATVALLGEGLCSTGYYRETLSLAVACDLPLVLVCKSQVWPDGAPIEAGVFGDGVGARARTMGLWSRRVDGADVVAVAAAVSKALERARQGHGPALVEAVVTHMQHKDAPAHRDPVERLRRHLDHAGVWTSTFQDVIEAEIRGHIARAQGRAQAREEGSAA